MKKVREFLTCIIEGLSLCDFVTDVVILYKLYNSIHIAWTSWSIVIMLAPFYICHIPYMSFIVDKQNQKRNQEWSWTCPSSWNEFKQAVSDIWQYLLCLILVLPFANVVFLQLMELAFFFFISTSFLNIIHFLPNNVNNVIRDWLDKFFLVVYQ